MFPVWEYNVRVSEQRRRRQRQRNNPKPPFRAEEIAAIVLAVITFFIGVLPVIPLWGRFACIVLFLICVVDLCLRSERVKDHFQSPFTRLTLSIVSILFIVALAWNPMRTKYAQEHLPPNLIFIVGGPLGDDRSPVWQLEFRHFGSGPAYNCGAEFNDLVQVGRESQFHAHSTPLGSNRIFKAIPEVDPVQAGGFGSFNWIPRDPNYQHYSLDVVCRDGEFLEDLTFVRVDGILHARLSIKRPDYLLKENPELDPVVLSCGDPYIPEYPHLTPSVATDPYSFVYPYWHSNHLYWTGTVVQSPPPPGAIPPVLSATDEHNEEMFLRGRTLEDRPCFMLLTTKRHLGDLQLPLNFSWGEIVIGVYGLLVLVLPLYCLWALWIMGVPLVSV